MQHPTTRRSFINAGSLGFLGLSLRGALAAADADTAPTGKAKSVILFWLEGGPSHIDTWDPKPNSNFKPISTNVPGIQVSELLPKMAKRMDKFALVRSMHTRGTDHPQATHYAITGHEINPAMQFPSLGSIITKEMGPRNAVPAHILVPKWDRTRQYEEYFRSAFLGGDYDPMCIPDPSKPGFEVTDLSLPKNVSQAAVESRSAFLNAVDRRYRALNETAEHTNMDAFTAQALKMILTPAVRDAFDLSKESDKTKERYGKDSIGQSCLLARRLVEAGSRFVTAAGYHSVSWDTHSDNDKGHKDRLCPPLDRTLTALVEDLDERGLLESTLVIAMGEFGRTPIINPALGRDHWPNCWSLALAGAGIKTGQAVGASDERGANVIDRVVSMGDLYATIYKALGIDWKKEYMSPIGRPIKIANSLDDRTGSPVTELLAYSLGMPKTPRSTLWIRTAAALCCGVLLTIAALIPPRVSGQAAVSLSRPGQEDLSFWVNHNGLLQFDVEGEVGFGDMARVLLRRRANAESIRKLRDRFTFRIQEPVLLETPDVFHAEFANGALSWRSAPTARFVVGSGRTFNIAVVVRNGGITDLQLDALYRNSSMDSAAPKITVAPGRAVPLFLRAVETRLGEAEGKLTLRHAGGELAADLRFDVRALAPLRVHVVDERGRPAAARVYLTGSDGLAYAPGGSSARITAMSAEYFFHADDTFDIEMPAGEALIEATRGQEYRLATERVTLQPGKPAEATLRLTRWANLREQGYWSADVHIHANYTAPHHQVIEPRDVRLQIAAEDLNYGNMMVANSSGAFIHDQQYFEGAPHRLSSPEHFIYWNEENRSSAYGHMCFLGLKRLVEPFYNGFRNTPFADDYPANYELAQQVYEQGGAVSYAHPGMFADFDRASIKELPVDLALGQKPAMDVLSNNDENATMEMWYRLLNCGFRVPISAGTDSFTNVADHYIAGGGRVYVQAGPRFEYRSWLDAYRNGRSFASNGPIVKLEVEGKLPGDKIRLDAPRGVTAKVAMTTNVPVDRVELMVNGKVVESQATAGKDKVDFTRRIPLERSSWIAVRALGPRHRLILNDTMAFAHTSPVYVSIGDRPVRELEDVRFYRDWVERLIARAERTSRFATPERKAEVTALFSKALAWFRGAESGN